MIKKCHCAHDYQDRKYGAGNRVHNPVGKKRQTQGVYWRCTICKSEKGEK